MSESVRTIKLFLETSVSDDALFTELTKEYASACNYISEYVFNNGFILNYFKQQEKLYAEIRENTPLKSQMTISALKTVTARYKTVKEQLYQHPYKYQDENGS